MLKPHEWYEALGKTDEARQESYRELFSISMDRQDIHSIREAARFSMPLGNNRFKEQIERALNVKLGYAKIGGPKIEEEMAIYYL